GNCASPRRGSISTTRPPACCITARRSVGCAASYATTCPGVEIVPLVPSVWAARTNVRGSGTSGSVTTVDQNPPGEVTAVPTTAPSTVTSTTLPGSDRPQTGTGNSAVRSTELRLSLRTMAAPDPSGSLPNEWVIDAATESESTAKPVSTA